MKFKLYVELCVIPLIGLVSSEVYQTNRNERFSKVRYLISDRNEQSKQGEKTSSPSPNRPLFFWESSPSATESTSQFSVTFPVIRTTSPSNTETTAQNKGGKLRKNQTQQRTDPKIRHHRNKERKKQQKRKRKKKRRRKSKIDTITGEGGKLLLEKTTNDGQRRFYDVLDTAAPTITTESIYKKRWKVGNKWDQSVSERNDRISSSKHDLDGLNNELNVLEPNRADVYLEREFYNSSTPPESRGMSRRFKCGINNGGCAHICNKFSKQKCSCLDGFVLGNDSRSCSDVNECLINNGGCESRCYNIPGSFYCSCPSGLRIGDDLKSCEDVNECLLRNGHGPCQDLCTNTFGSYFCSCSGLNGTFLAEDGRTCKDVDECQEGRSGCTHGCINTHGRAFCTCPDGMELGSDWKTCHDINECENEEIQKSCKYGCLNTDGSYYCLNDLQNDEIPPVPEHISCPPLFPPRHGFLHCSRKKAALGGFKTRTGRDRVTNRPGTFCELVCPMGYKNVGDFRLTCGLNGTWIGETNGKCALLLGRNFDLRRNYIQVRWDFPKPKIKCPGSMTVDLKRGEEATRVSFPPPKASVDWKYVEAFPSYAKNLELYLPQGHHWVTFKATNPYNQLSAKCIIYIVVRKPKILYHKYRLY